MTCSWDHDSKVLTFLLQRILPAFSEVPSEVCNCCSIISSLMVDQCCSMSQCWPMAQWNYLFTLPSFGWVQILVWLARKTGFMTFFMRYQSAWTLQWLAWPSRKRIVVPWCPVSIEQSVVHMHKTFLSIFVVSTWCLVSQQGQLWKSWCCSTFSHFLTMVSFSFLFLFFLCLPLSSFFHSIVAFLVKSCIKKCWWVFKKNQAATICRGEGKKNSLCLTPSQWSTNFHSRINQFPLNNQPTDLHIPNTDWLTTHHLKNRTTINQNTLLHTIIIS